MTIILKAKPEHRVICVFICQLVETVYGYCIMVPKKSAIRGSLQGKIPFFGEPVTFAGFLMLDYECPMDSGQSEHSKFHFKIGDTSL